MAFNLAQFGATNVTHVGGAPADEDEDSVFHIPSKSQEEYQRKAQCERRSRYPSDLESNEEASPGEGLKGGELARRFKAVVHAYRAVRRFEKAGNEYEEDPMPEGFGITSLLQHSTHHNRAFLEDHGGVQGLAKHFKSDVRTGIDDRASSIERRKEEFGVNKISSKPGKSLLGYAWEASQDPTLIIMVVCALLSFPMDMFSDGPKEGWFDGFSIGIAFFLIIVVTAVSDYRHSLQFQSLSEEKKNIKVEVIRGGRRFRLPVYDIVVGDIVAINIGDQVPADGILVSGRPLCVDESIMTGESVPTYKDKEDPFLLRGFKVVDGYGTMMVIAVGTRTYWGQIISTLSEDSDKETPLQVRLNETKAFICKLGAIVATLVFAALLIRFAVTVHFADNRSASVRSRVFDMFGIPMDLFVVALPLDLALVVSIMRACSLRKMRDDKALVRNLAACETIGSGTVICINKTGTLTQNQMAVIQSVVGDMDLEPESIKSLPKALYDSLLVGVCCNTAGSVVTTNDGGEAQVSGSPTESAILSWGLKLGMNYREIQSANSVERVEAFNSQKKRSGVVVRRANGDVETHWKGAAEVILEMCDKWVDRSGNLRPIDQNKTEIFNRVEGMAAKGLRCVAFAHGKLEPSHLPKSTEELSMRACKIPDKHLTFVAVVGIENPCRPDVRKTVEKFQAAGVKVLMVTGDSVSTAKAISQECGILDLTTDDEDAVVEGRALTLKHCTPEERKKMLSSLKVVARASPSEKLALFKALQETGEVVAVFGDGINDVPALSKADVAISMGKSGTGAAKEASDIVLLDDNFASILKVFWQGRSVYAKIQKFLQFRLIASATAVVLTFAIAVSVGKVPLTGAHLLWVGFVTNTLGALVSAREAPTDDLMSHRPVGRKEPLITKKMWCNIITLSAYQFVILFLLHLVGSKFFIYQPDGEVRKDTLVFNTFVMCQLFNEIHARQPEQNNILKGWLENQLFSGTVVVVFAFQVVIVQYLGKFAVTAPLTLLQWLASIGLGAFGWFLAPVTDNLTREGGVREEGVGEEGVRLLVRRGLEDIDNSPV